MPFHNGITDVVIHQVPVRHGQSKHGVEEAPTFLLNAGLEKKIEKRGLKLSSNIDLAFEISPDQTTWEICSKMSQKLAKSTFEHAKLGQFIINLGGDHSLGTGSISGMLQAYPDLCVIWIDAHTDINTKDTSPSQHIHGMPVSFVLNDPREKSIRAVPSEYQWCRKNLLDPSRLAYIGIRQTDQGEMYTVGKLSETVRDLKICTYDMVSIERQGIAACISKALERIDPKSNRPIHVSFDVDSLDPTLAPATGTPVPGGLTLREILYVAETIYATGRLAGLDVVEVNPKLEMEKEMVDKTLKNAMRSINAFLGKARPSFN